MFKIFYTLLMIACAALFSISASAQEKKAAEAPKPADSPYKEMLWDWNDIGRKLIDMAEDFPEAKYDFKAQKDERTFAENLIHVVADEYNIISAIKGITVGPTGDEKALHEQYPTKAEIVNLMKQVVADGAQVIEEQGDSGLTREFLYPYANIMIHGSAGWLGTIEHAGEHYGQLVVYYRLNDMIPPESRPKK